MKPPLVRMTNQREVVLEELQKVKNHPTADELFVNVRKRLPRISLATVYRTLETLERVGLVQKININSNQMRFDGDTSEHYHITCVKCGRVDDIPSSAVKKVDAELGKIEGYRVIGHQIHFYGVCENCSKNEKNPDLANR